MTGQIWQDARQMKQTSLDFGQHGWVISEEVQAWQSRWLNEMEVNGGFFKYGSVANEWQVWRVAQMDVVGAEDLLTDCASCPFLKDEKGLTFLSEVHFKWEAECKKT